MAPMIDVIFLLLIFFLVAGKWKPQQAQLPFELPAAGGATTQIGRAEPLVLRLTNQEGKCFVSFAGNEILLEENAPAQSLALMLGKLQNTLQTQKRNTTDPVEILCGQEVEWDYFAKVYNVLYGAGITDITFTVTEPE